MSGKLQIVDRQSHIDLQVINAPILALSQSLGLQAKDWEILTWLLIQKLEACPVASEGR
ncbi:hypothetical protein METHPM2_1340013 [Pseudomonas sp. PM2]